MSNPSSIVVQECLDRLRDGDSSAQERLFAVAGNRLRRLAASMFKGSERVQRWEEVDDVLQNTLIRLHRSLAEVRPTTVREFFQFATLQIRRELVDLARHYYGAHGLGFNHASTAANSSSSPGVAEPPSEETTDGDQLALWTELHERAKNLPAEERETFDLLWYQGLTQEDAATVLGVSSRTIQRRWYAACQLLRGAAAVP